MVVDTWFPDLFIPAATCTSCTGHTLYDPTKSRTSHALGNTYNPSQITPGYDVAGAGYTDNITVAGLTATAQTFAAVRPSATFTLLPLTTTYIGYRLRSQSWHVNHIDLSL